MGAASGVSFYSAAWGAAVNLTGLKRARKNIGVLLGRVICELELECRKDLWDRDKFREGELQDKISRLELAKRRCNSCIDKERRYQKGRGG